MKNFFLKTGLTLLCLIIGLGSARGEDYELVTTAPTDWSGSYLFAYVNGSSAYVYNGTDSGAKNGVSATISSNKISSASGMAVIEVASMTGGYSLKVVGGTNNGKFLSGGTKNGTTFNTSAVANSLSMNTDGTVKINNNTSTSFQFNSASDQQRFRYFASAQKGVKLFKKVEASSTKTLSSIAVKTAPTKTTYTEGENFDPTGLVLTGTYSDKSTEDIAYSGNESDFTFSPSLDTELTTSNTSVTITYGGKSTTQSITVNEAPKHTVSFYSNGTLYTSAQYAEGADITLPTGLSAINGKNFVGWVADEISGTTDTAPSFVTSPTMGTSDVTYYAVFATQTGSGTTSYEKLTSNSFDTNATYVLAANESSNSNTLHYFSTYTTVTANESWGVTSTDPEDAITFTLSGTASALKAMDADGAYIQALATGKFRMSGSVQTLNLNNDGTISNPTSGSTGYNLRYNHNSGSGGFRWYNGTTGCSAYFYKVICSATYSAYCTTVEEQAGDPEISNFIKTATLELEVGAESYDIRSCLNIPFDYDTNTYAITTTIDGTTQKDNEYACVYPYISFSKAGEYTVHVVAAAMPGKYAQTEGDITVTVTQPTEAITTIEGIYTFAESVGEKDGEKGEHGESATLTFNNWVVTGVKNTGTQVYVTDGTKGFILYSKDSGFEVGDIISGTVDVHISLYHGAATVEDVKATTPGINVTKNGTITPTTTTIDALSAQNTGSVVSLQNLTWNSTDKVFSDGTNTIAYFNGIIPKDDTAPTLENGKKYNITGIYLQWNTINYDVTPHTTTATIGEIMPRSLEDVEPITVITKYKVTIEAPAHGTLVVKHGDDTVQSGDEFEEGEKLQITATPKTGYKFRNWQAYDGTTHTFTTSFEWEMSAHDVTLRANFDEIQDYTIAWSVNGKIVKSETLEEGAEVVPVQPTDDLFTAAVPTGVTKVFTGWVTTPTVVADATPSYVTPAATANENVTYYAVFAQKTGSGSVTDGDYELVEDDHEDWSGEYIIAGKKGDDYIAALPYTSGNNVKSTDASVTNNKITSDGAARLIVTKKDGYYTIEDGTYYWYAAGTNSNNYMKGSSSLPTSNYETYLWTISYTNDKISIVCKADISRNTIRFNSGNNPPLFSCYEEGKQNDILLFKKSATTGGTTYSDFTTLVSCEISISQYGATSFSVPRNYTMPDGITGKTITAKKKVDSLGNGYYKLTYSADYEEGSVVPAGESLVLYGEPGDYTIIYEGTPEKTLKEGNLLHGVYEAEDSKFRTTYDKENSSSYYYYKLTTKSGANFGWYYGATDGAPFLMSRDDRAYLVIEKEIAAGIRGFALEDGEEEDLTTDINNIETSSTNTIYNLQGLQQSKLQKGINIVNGKKVIR